MKYLFLLSVCALPFLLGFSQNADSTTCADPANVTLTSQGSGTVSFDWDDNRDAVEYLVWHQQQGSSTTSAVFSTSTSDFTFNGLSAGTYDFYFQCDCGDAIGQSNWIITEDIIME